MINDEYMDYFHAIGAKFRPKPDTLKLLLVAGAAFISTIIMSALLLGFYWNGDWHLKTVNGENYTHAESHSGDNHSTENHSKDPAETHDQPMATSPDKSADHH